MSEPTEKTEISKPQGYVQPLGKISHYELLKKIAEGGMGSIYMARNIKDKSVVAIKVMSPNYVHNPVLLKRFEQELFDFIDGAHSDIISTIGVQKEITADAKTKLDAALAGFVEGFRRSL